MRAGVLAALALMALGGCSGRATRPDRALARRPPAEARAPEPSAEPVVETTPEIVIEPDWREPYASREALRSFDGAVSYYHDSLAGNSTASGEPYDPSAFTAANRDLPFGTVLRVVRLDTGTSVIVRVNDRGPFGRRRRILDLSRAAAEELGMIERGVIRARAEILEMGETRRPR